VPVLLGFKPEDSLVVIGLASDRRAIVSLRYDLPAPGETDLAESAVDHALGVIESAGAVSAVAVIYGSEGASSAVAAELRRGRVPVHEILRADHGRYWSYMCPYSECCPPEGKPFEAAAVLSTREALAASIAPGRLETRDYIGRAVARLDADGFELSRALMAVKYAIGRYRAGDGISDFTSVKVLLGLRQLRVRDDAWARMEPEFVKAHLQLWTDLTRMAPAGYVAAPASLLAFAAWQSGNGALANVALDRALADDSSYSMALLLCQVICSGAPPSLARMSMTPEEVAASYAEQANA
jgi:hypothetical protein